MAHSEPNGTDSIPQTPESPREARQAAKYREMFDELRSVLENVIQQAKAEEIPNDVRQKTRLLFWRAINHGLLHGRAKEKLAGAAFYVAVRVEGHPLRYQEIFSCTEVDDEQVLNHCYGVLCRELGIKIQPQDPKAHIKPILDELNMPSEGMIKDTADAALEAAMEQNLHSGTVPASLAAGAVYEAAEIEGQAVYQKEVAAAADICHATLSKHTKSIRQVRPRRSATVQSVRARKLDDKQFSKLQFAITNLIADSARIPGPELHKNVLDRARTMYWCGIEGDLHRLHSPEAVAAASLLVSSCYKDIQKLSREAAFQAAYQYGNVSSQAKLNNCAEDLSVAFLAEPCPPSNW